jgi:hypothetical protein
VACWKGHHNDWPRERHPHQTSSSPGAGAQAALWIERTYPMMYDLAVPIVVTATGSVTLAAVYVVSKDPERRRRAWQLLKLLLGR